MDEDKVHIDYSELVRQLADKAVADLFASFMPDEPQRKLITSIFAIHRKYGVDTATTVKILMELGEILKEEDK